MSKQDKVILSVREVCRSFAVGRGRQQVLQGVNLRLERGEFVAIMGASGSGKSTLLHIIGLLDRPDRGEVHFEGQEIFGLSRARQDRIRCEDMGFVFQFYHLLPELNVMENVLLPMMVDSSLLGWLGRRGPARKRVEVLLAAVGLEDQARQKPATLSGGERQRAALARALVQQPKLLLADEPTGNLDSAAGMAILELFRELNRSGQTIVMVTHDHAVADRADRKLQLRNGKIE